MNFTIYSKAIEHPIIAGYYPSWMTTILPVESIPFNSLTHIIHAFVWPLADGSIYKESQIPNKSLTDQAHDHGVQVLIAIGGGGHSENFSAVTADSQLQETFIENAIQLCDEFGYDGIDIDWEFPSGSSERAQFSSLVQNFRDVMADWEVDLLLTMAAPATNWGGQGIDFSAVKDHLDWFNVMTYDFFGSWVTVAGHNSPLYPPKINNNGSVKSGFEYITITRGVSKDKVLIGLPFYGRGCKATGLNQSNAGENTEYRYSDIANKVGNGWDYHWDDVSKVPYLTDSDGTHFISFDDTTSIRYKCEFAINNNIGGVMIWALGQDVIGNKQPLLETVSKTLSNATRIDMFNPVQKMDYIMVKNFPNPFNDLSLIEYYLPEQSSVKIEFFNISGQQVQALDRQVQSKGWHQIPFYSGSLPSGNYLYRVTALHSCVNGKMTLIK